jgi:hypothetical protein
MTQRSLPLLRAANTIDSYLPRIQTDDKFLGKGRTCFFILRLAVMEVTTPKIRVVLGTMAIGGTMNQDTSRQLLELFSSYGHFEVDTALMYQGGKTEKVKP